MTIDTTLLAADMKMSPEDFASLRADVARITQTDVQLGRVLSALVLQLGHAHGLDPVAEDTRLAAKAKEDARAAEDTRLKNEAEALAKLRTVEDAQPRTSAEKETLLVRRAAQDIQIKNDAESLAKAREEDDKQTAAREQEDAKANAPDNVAVNRDTDTSPRVPVVTTTPGESEQANAN